jgi:hypothetical protein
MDGARDAHGCVLWHPPDGQAAVLRRHYHLSRPGRKIAEEVYLGDRLGLWQQLGLVPTSRKLAA